jgi:hypothetical protein
MLALAEWHDLAVLGAVFIFLMGNLAVLLYRLRRARAADLEPRPDRPDEAAADDPACPRRQHSLFTYVGLRLLAFADPPRFLSLAGGEQSGEFLRDVWRRAGDQAREEGQRGDWPCGGLEGAAVDIAGRPAVLITAPPAERPLEAHYVAVILADRDSRSVLYCTLENPVRLVPGLPRPVVGTLTASGAHHQHGSLFSTERAVFLQEAAKLAAAHFHEPAADGPDDPAPGRQT